MIDNMLIAIFFLLVANILISLLRRPPCILNPPKPQDKLDAADDFSRGELHEFLRKQHAYQQRGEIRAANAPFPPGGRDISVDELYAMVSEAHERQQAEQAEPRVNHAPGD